MRDLWSVKGSLALLKQFANRVGAHLFTSSECFHLQWDYNGDHSPIVNAASKQMLERCRYHNCKVAGKPLKMAQGLLFLCNHERLFVATLFMHMVLDTCHYK